MDTNDILNKSLGSQAKVKSHHMSIRDRKSLEISGVKKIESLNSEEFVLETFLGYMTIGGQDLEMKNLNIEKGDIAISGYVTKIEYYDHQEEKAVTKGFFNKMFK